MDNPILVEVTRGPLVESVHRGAVAVADPDGGMLLSVGGIDRPVFARSSIKLIQAMPMVESGAADLFGFRAPEIALACGSHTGTARHVDVARRMADRLGVDETCLVCGAAEPSGRGAARLLAASGAKGTAFHHQCSGKHLGFVAVAIESGAPVQGYGQPSHPVQKLIVETLSDLTGAALGPSDTGIDGCAVPTYALPLSTLARLFARIATGDRMSPQRRAAVVRILDACWREPELVSGAGRTDTVVMSALPGRVYMKTGAEGVYCGALPELGLGFALKIDDGAARASAAAVMPLVERLIPDARGLIKRGTLKTAAGFEAGAIRTAAGYERLLAGLDVSGRLTASAFEGQQGRL